MEKLPNPLPALWLSFPLFSGNVDFFPGGAGPPSAETLKREKSQSWVWTGCLWKAPRLWCREGESPAKPKWHHSPVKVTSTLTKSSLCLTTASLEVNFEILPKVSRLLHEIYSSSVFLESFLRRREENFNSGLIQTTSDEKQGKKQNRIWI